MADERRTALVVDDDTNVAEVLARYGTMRGYDVIIATSVTNALQHIGTRFNLLIVDGLEGRCWEVFPEITADRKILYSANNNLLKSSKVTELEIEAFDKTAEKNPLPTIFV